MRFKLKNFHIRNLAIFAIFTNFILIILYKIVEKSIEPEVLNSFILSSTGIATLSWAICWRHGYYKTEKLELMKSMDEEVS